MLASQILLVSLIAVSLAPTNQAFFTFDLTDVFTRIKSDIKTINNIVASEAALSRVELFNATNYYKTNLASNFTTSHGERYNYGGCACEMVSCLCCAKFEIAARDTVCSSLAFNVSNGMMEADLEMSPIFNETFAETFSARMPKTQCYEIINNQTFCSTFYNFVVSHDNTEVNGCLEVSVKDENSSTLANMRVGCFGMLYAAGHSFYAKDIVSVHSSEGDQYVSRFNPLKFFHIFV